MSVSTAGLIASAPVAWASSSRYLTVPFGAILRTYDVSESPPKCIASHVGHASAISSTLPLPDMRVASASKDGTLRLWDLRTGQCMRTIDVGRPLSTINFVSFEKVIGYANKELNIIDLSKRGKGGYHKILKSHVRILRNEEGRVVSAQDGQIVAIIEGNGLHLTSTARKLEPLLTIPYRNILTSVAVTDDASKLAVGDETGVIWIYHDLARELSQLKKGRNILRPSALNVSKLHWHHSAVRALTFSHHGRVLLSGGQETVLVSWQMSRTNFGTKTFVPRLKAPITGIAVSPDEKCYATTHSDNAVRIIDQRSGSVIDSIRGVACRLLDVCSDNPKHMFSSRLDPSCVKHFAATNDRMNPTRLFLTGTGPTIQSFEVHLGEQVAEFSVAPKNIVYEPIEKAKARTHPDQLLVTSIAVHKHRNLIATVDHQDLRAVDTSFYGTKKGVTNLRIWNREADGNLRLISVINEPHGSGNPVTDISFHPHLPCFSTTSPCGTARFWSENETEKNRWRCESEKSYKGLPSNAVTFSHDGSLQAIAYGNVVTIWTVETTESLGDTETSTGTNENEQETMNLHPRAELELFRVLVHPPLHEFVQRLAFIRGRAPILLAATKHGLYAWNIITQGIWWSHRFSCDPRTLVADENSNHFAISIRIPPLVPSSLGNCFDTGQKGRRSGLKSDDVSYRELLPSSDKPPLSMDAENDSQQRNIAENTTNINQRESGLGDTSNYNNTQKPQVSCGTSQEKVYKTDCAIALFDTSPVPKSVYRLSPGLGVVALAFVQLGSNKSGSNQSLVSFDTNLKVTVHRSHDLIEETGSAITTEINSPPVDVENTKQPGHIEKLLGETWQDELRGSSTKNESEIKMSNMNDDSNPENDVNGSKPEGFVEAISEAFQGAVHFQGPVPSRLPHLMASLLQNRRKGCESKFVRTASEIGEPTKSEKSISSVNGISSNQHIQHTKRKNETERRSFCRSLIHINPPQSSTNEAKLEG